MQLRDVMRRNFITLAADASLASALELVRLTRVRTLPVVDGAVFVGFASGHDLLRTALERLLADPADSLAVPVSSLVDPVVGLAPGDSLDGGVRLLCEGGRGCLPVVDPAARGALVGLVIESDLLRRAYGLAARPPD